MAIRAEYYRVTGGGNNPAGGTRENEKGGAVTVRRFSPNFELYARYYYSYSRSALRHRDRHAGPVPIRQSSSKHAVELYTP